MAVTVFILCPLIKPLHRPVSYWTRDEAKADVFDYIERFYNPKRRHSTIGYLSQFEMRAG